MGCERRITNLTEYAKLVRLSHTFFALPFALASMAVAAGGLPDFSVLLLIILCMFTARNGAMAFNRLADAKFDALNPRTSARHLPAGKISKKSAAMFIVINGVLFISFAYLLNDLAFYCALPVFLFLLSYSLWKRFSCLSHFMLGLAIGASPLGAWIAVRGEFALFPALLGLMLAFWIAGFDIIYASQDYETDKQLGLHSIPVSLGIRGAAIAAFASHIVMMAVALFIGFFWSLGIVWNITLGIIFCVLFYIHLFRKSNDLDSVNRDFFLANIAISFLVLIGLSIWIALGGTDAFNS